jgi:hypothetical protein
LWGIYRILYVPSEEEIRWCKMRGKRWPCDNATSANPLPWKLFSPRLQDENAVGIKMSLKTFVITNS